MIRCLLALPLATLGGASLVWALTLLVWTPPVHLAARAAGDLTRAFRDEGTRACLLREGLTWGSQLHARLPHPPGETSAVLEDGLQAAALHAGVAFETLPFGLLLVLGGILGGMLLRERLRLGTGYASPTVGYLARYVASSGLLFIGTYALTPLPLTSAWLYPAWFFVSLGGLLYAANLPIRI